jgi:hypothetical protein
MDQKTHEIEIHGCVQAPLDLTVDQFTDLFIFQNIICYSLEYIFQFIKYSC